MRIIKKQSENTAHYSTNTDNTALDEQAYFGLPQNILPLTVGLFLSGAA